MPGETRQCRDLGKRRLWAGNHETIKRELRSKSLQVQLSLGCKENLG
jgi:hypothetical protein